jgi:cadmium resistance protein CadD (predicted permease)
MMTVAPQYRGLSPPKTVGEGLSKSIFIVSLLLTTITGLVEFNMITLGVSPIIIWILAGVAAWFATGIDDLLFFLDNYLTAKNTREKVLAILGLLLGVLIMICLVFLLGTKAAKIGKWVWIGGLFPLGIGASAIHSYYRGEDKENKTQSGILQVMHRAIDTLSTFFGKAGIFGRALFLFLMNCTDDIGVNTSRIAGRSMDFTWAYLGGILLGLMIMVSIVAQLASTKSGQKMRDMPRLRGSILVIIGIILIIKGLTA